MKITNSERMFEQACRLMPGGVNSPVRAFRAVEMTPRFIKMAKGSKIYDVDDNEYIDFVGSWGPMILGHARDEVVEAVCRAAKLGNKLWRSHRGGDRAGAAYCRCCALRGNGPFGQFRNGGCDECCAGRQRLHRP